MPRSTSSASPKKERSSESPKKERSSASPKKERSDAPPRLARSTSAPTNRYGALYDRAPVINRPSSWGTCGRIQKAQTRITHPASKNLTARNEVRAMREVGLVDVSQNHGAGLATCTGVMRTVPARPKPPLHTETAYDRDFYFKLRDAKTDFEHLPAGLATGNPVDFLPKEFYTMREKWARPPINDTTTYNTFYPGKQPPRKGMEKGYRPFGQMWSPPQEAHLASQAPEKINSPDALSRASTRSGGKPGGYPAASEKSFATASTGSTPMTIRDHRH